MIVRSWTDYPVLNIPTMKGQATTCRAVFLHRQGEIRDRTFEDQSFHASGVSLIASAAVHRNTVYLDRAVQQLDLRTSRFLTTSSHASRRSAGSASGPVALPCCPSPGPIQSSGLYAMLTPRSCASGLAYDFSQIVW
jgi:Tn3 transposase DDE domain